MEKAEREPVSDVVWEAPTESQRGRYDWAAIGRQLRSRPGVWAKVFENDRTSIVNAIRQGAIGPLDPRDGFQVRTRNNVRYPVRRCSLYMRYVPLKVKE